MWNYGQTVDEACNLQEPAYVRQLSSISSQDSGFVSHDVLPAHDISCNPDVSSLSLLRV